MNLANIDPISTITAHARITHARITAMPIEMTDPLPCVVVRVDEQKEVRLFEYYPDEISFEVDDFIGLSVGEAMQLKIARDVAFLQDREPPSSPSKMKI